MALDFRVGVPGEKCFGAHRVRPSEHPRLLGESCQLSLTVTMRTCVSPSPGDRERGPGPGASPPEDPGASPGGVELVMSPQVALCEAGSRESSAGGLCRAGLARREAGWTASRWARITQAGSGSAPAPASPGIGLCRSESRRGSGRGGGEGYSEVVLKTWSVKVVVMVRSDESSSSEGLLQRRPSASPGCDARGR